MILPGLVSLAFYKRPPSRRTVLLGLGFTVVLSALLGYISPGGPIGQLGSVLVAIAGGVALYFAILVFLRTRYAREIHPAAATHPEPPTP